MDKIVSVTPISCEPDVFVNGESLWLPPRARGIYGGTYLGQSLSAAQQTVPPNFLPHSMHCNFVQAGKPDALLRYYVTRVSDGRSFSTRQVVVIQGSTTVFLATISLCPQYEPLSSKSQFECLAHAIPMPGDIPEPTESCDSLTHCNEAPYINKKVGVLPIEQLNGSGNAAPYGKKVHHWYKAKEKLPPSTQTHIHISSLAYISDSYMVGVLPHVHNVWDFVNPPETEFDPGGIDLSSLSKSHLRIPAPDETEDSLSQRRKIGMMVTLSHSMYFHNVFDIRADEWMLAELQSDWAGEGRGTISQKIWTRQGKLIATCTQEGIVRLADLRAPNSRPTRSAHKL